MKKILLSMVFLLLAAFAFAAEKTITFQWDYSPETELDLAGFRIYASRVSGQYDHGTDKIMDLSYSGEPSANGTYTGDGALNSPAGEKVTWYFVATAYDVSGNESVHSNEIWTVIDLKQPAPIINFRVAVPVVSE